MFYFVDANNIVDSSKRYSEKIKETKVDLEKIKNDDRYSKIYSAFFNSRSFNYFKGDTLYLEGSKPPVTFDFVYQALNKKTFVNEPLYVVMDYCSDFFELYNANIQDRFSFVASNSFIKVDDYVIPLFIAFLELRNIYSAIEPMLFINDGQIVFRFESLSIEYSFRNTITYDFLINVLKLQDKKTVDRILENELQFERNGKVLIIRKTLYKVFQKGKEERIVNYIKAKKEVTAQELADYFGLTKRMINYYIADLIDKGIVVREGNTNSALAKYKINSTNISFRI